MKKIFTYFMVVLYNMYDFLTIYFWRFSATLSMALDHFYRSWYSFLKIYLTALNICLYIWPGICYQLVTPCDFFIVRYFIYVQPSGWSGNWQKVSQLDLFASNIRDRGQMAYFRENLQTHVAPSKFYDS